MRTFRLALAQINIVVGDLPGNTAKILAGIEQARAVAADLVAFPELAIPGYPPEDLLLKTDFIHANRLALDQVVQASAGLTVVVGFVDANSDIYNAAAVCHNGVLAGIYHKHYLPSYSVFDEDRYFQAGQQNPVFNINGTWVGITICEDIWYPAGPHEVQALEGGAELLLNISSSPYYARKGLARARMLATRAADSAAIVAYCNLVGGQDELVFDGQSFVFDSSGEMVARGQSFAEDFIVVDLDMERVFNQRLHNPLRRKEVTYHNNVVEQVERVSLPSLPSPAPKPPLQGGLHLAAELQPLAEIYAALILGTHDYVTKTGFSNVVIGLSGGIDSSITACIAVDALGKDAVVGVIMPTRYNSPASAEDAAVLAQALGIRILTIPIDKTYQAYLEMLAEPFTGRKPDTTEENIQSRIRGNVLMALSNKFGWLVLTTGNKSEVGVGYSTLYGDSAGGFAVIKDIPKNLVYALARHREQIRGRAIPERVFIKAPSAELRYDQKDSDSLPEYNVLDPILEAYVEDDQSLAQIVAQGYDEALVRRVIRLVDLNEYKRRQSPPGIKISTRAFGKDRRLPITNRYRPK